MRKVEVFAAGCPVCDPIVKLVQDLACPNCEVTIYDLREGCATNECRDKAKSYEISRIPAVVVDGQLAECCKNIEITREGLIAAGIGGK